MKTLLLTPIPLLLLFALALASCDAYEPPLAQTPDPGDAGPRGAVVGNAALSKNVAGETGGVDLLGYHIQLDVGSGAGILNAVDSYSSFTWVVTPDEPVGDVTHFAVEIPQCAGDTFSVSPTEGTNQNNSTLIAETNVEFHPSNGSKQPDQQSFTVEFDTQSYQVGFIKVALRTNGGFQDWTYTLGPCARRFDPSGVVFLDDNGDRIRATDGSEPGFEGATVVLEERDPDLGTWSILDQTTTNSDGEYIFYGVFTLGVYQAGVTLGPIPGGTDLSQLVITTPPTVSVSDISPFGNFGFDKFDILGKVYVDAKDTGDTPTEEDRQAGIGFVLIRLYTQDGTFVDETHSSSLLADLGEYTFFNLDPGDYIVRVEDVVDGLNAQLFDTFDSTEPVDGNLQPTYSYSLSIGNGLNGWGDPLDPDDPFYCDPALAVPGSACAVDFGWQANPGKISQTFAAEGATLTTADYNWWKKTMATACRLYARGTTPVLVLSDGTSQNLNEIALEIQQFAFGEPFLGDLPAGTADVCDLKVILERPIKTELDAYGTELLTAELNAFTPTFGLSLEGVPEYQATDPLFIYALLRYSEADYIERERDGFPVGKVGDYSGTETLKSYNGGGGGGGTGFE